MRYFIIFVAALNLSLTLGCSRNRQRLPEEYVNSRAQINFNALKSNPNTDSQALREIVLEAIRTDMLDTGKHPSRAIETSELMNLESVPPSYSTGTSRVNYNARVRLQYPHHWFDVQYLVFERDGELVVRRTSF